MATKFIAFRKEGIDIEKVIDMTGQRFGKLTVISRANNNKYGSARWNCVCDCGNEVVVIGKLLRNGHTKSCGCLNKEIVSKLCLKDHTGERFGRLTVLSRAKDYVAPNGKHHVRWLCKCDCGNETTVDVTQLVRGGTKSCGCLHLEKIAKGNPTHGGSRDRLYKTYYNMKNRCYNNRADDYKYYSGRGIQIYDEWNNNYLSFKAWAMDNGYDPTAPKGQCTIDRIDVNGNYEPSNCRWVDMATQSRNRRNVINK